MSRWGGRKVTTSRAYWRARLVAAGALPCFRCPRLVTPDQRWQVEHVIPRALGGRQDRSNEWVSHGRCNESAGGKLGAAITNARRPVVVARLGAERDRGIRGW